MELIIPVGIGAFVIIVSFFLLRWRFPRAGRQIAFIVGTLTLAGYVPYAILNWPGADIVAMAIALLAITAFILGFVSPPPHAENQKMSFQGGPATIVAFFTVIILLNAVFLTIATNGLPPAAAAQLLPDPRSGNMVESTQFPGIIRHDYQENEALFNEFLAERREQKERGWTVNRGWVGQPVAGRETPFRVEALDADGEPITNAVVTARFLRPSNEARDFEKQLAEVEPGVYQMLTDERLISGLWEVFVEVDNDGVRYEAGAQTRVSSGS